MRPVTFVVMLVLPKSAIPVSTISGRSFFFRFLIGAAFVAVLWPLDQRVDAALDVTRNPAWDRVAWWCSKIGEGWVIAVAGIVLALIFLLAGRSRVAANIFFAGLASLLAGLVATILRVLFGRTRPLSHESQGFYGVWHNGHWIIGKFEFSSFPSGHAATAAGLAAAVWLLHRGWAVPAVLYALAVIWSRVALQCHHLSDVLASTVLAIAIVVVLKPLLLPSIEFQFGNLHRAWKKK